MVPCSVLLLVLLCSLGNKEFYSLFFFADFQQSTFHRKVPKIIQRNTRYGDLSCLLSGSVSCSLFRWVFTKPVVVLQGGREVNDFIKYLAREATDELDGYSRDGKKRKTKKDKKTEL